MVTDRMRAPHLVRVTLAGLILVALLSLAGNAQAQSEGTLARVGRAGEPVPIGGGGAAAHRGGAGRHAAGLLVGPV